jgi:hypothetical protein
MRLHQQKARLYVPLGLLAITHSGASVARDTDLCAQLQAAQPVVLNGSGLLRWS